MSDPSDAPWSKQPNAPKVSRGTHLSEWAVFAGAPISTVFYGIIIALFFQCMGALLDPAKQRRASIRWLLVAHTMATFLFTTIYTALNIYALLVSFIDNRDFPGPGVFPPGPRGYLRLVAPTPIFIVADVPLVAVSLLADGLLLYRCHVMYAMNHWVIAFPSFLYFASLGTGIAYLWQLSHPYGSYWVDVTVNFGVIYLAISVSLNTILTLMIVIRLLLHNRIVLRSIGAQGTADGLYKFIVVVLVESCALYTISSIVFLGPWGIQSYVADCIFTVVVATQVIAPFLITLRIANRTALTSESVVGSASLMRFGSQGESAEGDETAPDMDPMDPVSGQGTISGGAGARARNVVQEVPM